MSTSMTERGSGGMSLFSSIERSTSLNLFSLVSTQIGNRGENATHSSGYASG